MPRERGGDGASPGKVRVDSSEKLWWLLYLRAAAAVNFARSKTLEKAGVKAPRRVVPCRSHFLFHPGLQRHLCTHMLSFSFAFTAGVYNTHVFAVWTHLDYLRSSVPRTREQTRTNCSDEDGMRTPLCSSSCGRCASRANQRKPDMDVDSLPYASPLPTLHFPTSITESHRRRACLVACVGIVATCRHYPPSPLQYRYRTPLVLFNFHVQHPSHEHFGNDGPTPASRRAIAPKIKLRTSIGRRSLRV